MRLSKFKLGAQEVLPPELPMPCTQKKTPDGPPSAGVQDTQHQSPVGHRHDSALVTLHKLAAGRFFLYHAADDWLINAGLIRPHELPPSIPGQVKVTDHGNSLVQAVRLSDGRVGLTLDASEALERDYYFQIFMAAVCESRVLQDSCAPRDRRES